MLHTIKRTHFTFPIPKQLNEVARLPLLKQETPVKIRQLWLEQFKHRPDVVVGTVAKAEFDAFRANAIACPMFIIPVMKGEGAYFNLVSQFQDGRHCLFTSLENFRRDPANSSPMMVMTIYDELVIEKGIALIRGDVINSLEITRADAQDAIKFLRHAYINRFDEVKRFNRNPREFDFNDFMQHYRQFKLEMSGSSNSL
jgi:ATP synthase F1 complex assembly factor 1